MQDHGQSPSPLWNQQQHRNLCSQRRLRLSRWECLPDSFGTHEATIPSLQIEAPQSWDEHPLSEEGDSGAIRWALNEEGDAFFAHSFVEWRVALLFESATETDYTPRAEDIKDLARVEGNTAIAVATAELHKKLMGLRVRIQPATIRSRDASLPSRTSRAGCPDRIPCPRAESTLWLSAASSGSAPTRWHASYEAKVIGQPNTT